MSETHAVGVLGHAYNHLTIRAINVPVSKEVFVNFRALQPYPQHVEYLGLINYRYINM